MANLTNKMEKHGGFTIVELLVVIVVIGILAAITIVSYTGVTKRAKVAQAVSNMNSVITVAETMSADNGFYPRLMADFTAGSTTTKVPTGVTVFFTGDTAISDTTGTSKVSYEYCGATATPAAGEAKGARVRAWDYNTGAMQTTYTYLGSGVIATSLPTANCNTYVTPAS